MAGGTWDPTAIPVRPGLYVNFVEAAAAQIQGGARGTVAIPLLTYSGTAQEKQVYTIEKEQQAVELFGAEHIRSIKLAMQGGAKEVLVYTMPAAPLAADYTEMRGTLDTHLFNVFVFDGEFQATEQTAVQSWVAQNRTEGKHFMVVFGGDAAADSDPTVGNSRSTSLNDDYVVNLINGVKLDDEVLTSAEFAPYMAGLIAGTAINRSITYTKVNGLDVNKRLTNAEVKTAIQAGSLVLVFDGEKVRVEQGIASSKKKIRAVRARQAVATDVTKTASDAYIGKIDNHADGQAALMAAIKAYLERLEASNVLQDIDVQLDPNQSSTGDQVFLAISYQEIDTMERILLTVNV
ncbi:phage tail sheath subtilisin-like domain-containing protein [Marinicrinis sediminis]|uniref:Phage tail sheath subtilisin-like domain-containing protein n=1 Tax=Marinicrinis sediminis TaxID=1652465 RepID=A0ABW5RA99_9BACL